MRVVVGWFSAKSSDIVHVVNSVYHEVTLTTRLPGAAPEGGIQSWGKRK